MRTFIHNLFTMFVFALAFTACGDAGDTIAGPSTAQVITTSMNVRTPELVTRGDTTWFTVDLRLHGIHIGDPTQHFTVTPSDSSVALIRVVPNSLERIQQYSPEDGAPETIFREGFWIIGQKTGLLQVSASHPLGFSAKSFPEIIPPPVLVGMSASPIHVRYGEGSLLKFISINATACRGVGGVNGWEDFQALRGTWWTGSLYRNTTFSFVCYHAHSSDVATITIIVDPPGRG